MDIRFTSTLTPEDENIAAGAILKALAEILDLLPIAYTLRIDTVDAHVYERSGTGERAFGVFGAQASSPFRQVGPTVGGRLAGQDPAAYQRALRAQTFRGGPHD